MQVALSNHTKTDTKQTRVLNRGRDSYNFPSYLCVTISPTMHFFSLRIRWNRDNSEPLHEDSPVNVLRSFPCSHGKISEHGSWPEERTPVTTKIYSHFLNWHHLTVKGVHNPLWRDASEIHNVSSLTRVICVTFRLLFIEFACPTNYSI